MLSISYPIYQKNRQIFVYISNFQVEISKFYSKVNTIVKNQSNFHLNFNTHRDFNMGATIYRNLDTHSQIFFRKFCNQRRKYERH